MKMPLRDRKGRHLYYYLHGKEARPVTTQEELERAWKHRQIADTHITHGGVDVRVSTVFLVIDHSHGEGEPVLFETMIFGGELDQRATRYRTYLEAEEAHRAICIEYVDRYPGASFVEVMDDLPLLDETCRGHDSN